MHQVALGLVGHHLEEIGEELALRGELDDVRPDDGADGDPLGCGRARLLECGDPRERVSEARGQLAVGDLEAPHRRPGALRVQEGLGPILGGELVEDGARVLQLGGELARFGFGTSRSGLSGTTA